MTFFQRKHIIAATSLGIVITFPSASRADNPIVQTLYTADPAPMVYEGRLYVYTGHDEDVLVNNFFTMNDWRVYSTTDMVNWTDHGSPLSYRSFSWSSGDAWAGQVIYRNGTFYYYVPTNRNGGKVLGVAVSNSPTGPFTDPIGKPLVTSDCGEIDPTVFIDDDGQAYLYWGNPNLCYVKLNSDMISYTGQVVHVPMTTASFGVRSNTDRPTTYEEGPWLHKRAGRYYMVFAAGPISEHIGYATSTSPTGTWTYGGVVMPTQGSSFTNHPGVVDFAGKSYFFYHNGALPGGGGYHRSVCVEEFAYTSSGAIPQMNMTTAGPAPVATLNPYVRTEAETIAWESGVETETCSEGGVDVTQISNGDYIKVRNVDFGTSGAKTFTARVASTTTGGAIELRLGSTSGTLVGTCTVPSTGGAQTWTTVTCNVSGATGIKNLYLRFTGSGFNFNYWQFTGGDGATGGTGSGGAATGGSATGGSATGGSATGGRATGGTATGGLTTGGRATGGTSSATGGTSSATGGTSSATGGTATGGTSGGSGGTTSVGGTGGSSGSPETCNCRTARGTDPGLAWLGALGLLLLGRTRRRTPGKRL